MGDIINTESKFKILVDAHKLIEEGDFEGSNRLMMELNLERPIGMHIGRGVWRK